MAGLPEINPLADYAATFDLFYQIVKLQIGNLKSDQYIQIRAVAEPLDMNKTYPWFSYYAYLSKVDTCLEATPITNTFASTDRAFSDEFERFINTALSFAEKKNSIPPRWI